MFGYVFKSFDSMYMHNMSIIGVFYIGVISMGRCSMYM